MVARTDNDWDDLVRDLAARVQAFAPEWTDHNPSDPGITLLELLAFLGESMLDRGDVSHRTRSRVVDLLRRLEAATSLPCGDAPLRRLHYASGRLLSVDDFIAEQEYVRAKGRRHNRLLHGVGIVSGLVVAVEPGSSRPRVTVSPGVAIAPDGNELLVCEPVSVTGRSRGGSPVSVTVRLVDQPVGRLPDGEPARMEERTEVTLVRDVGPDQLAIGRLERADGFWRVDPTFVPRRVTK